MMIRKLASIVLGVLAICAIHKPLAAQETVVFKPVYAKGESEKYRMVVTVETKGANNKSLPTIITLNTSELVKDVAQDGNVVLVTSLDSGTVNFNGQNIDLPATIPPVMTTLNKDGQVVKQEGGASMLQQLGFIHRLSRPIISAKEPLKIGEERKFQVPVSDDAAQKMSVSIKVIGKQPKTDDVPVETYKILTVADGAVPGARADQKSHVEITMYMEQGTGKALKMEGVITGSSTNQINQQKVTFTRVRLSPDAKPDGATEPKKDSKPAN